MKGQERLTPAARRAWDDSLLGQFPEDVAEALLRTAVSRPVAGGGSIQFRSQDKPSLVSLIVDGIARVYVRSESGREMTVRYVARSELVGLPAAVAGQSNPDVVVGAMIDTETVAFSAASLTQIAARDARVAWPIARYVAQTLHISEQLWGLSVFHQMSPRVAYHLLELCTRDQQGLVVQATQDELAHAVGSVREVVARTLKEFAHRGFIERGSHAIRVLDPAALHRVAFTPVR